MTKAYELLVPVTWTEPLTVNVTPLLVISCPLLVVPFVLCKMITGNGGCTPIVSSGEFPTVALAVTVMT
jgi:hypothetical protein